MFSFEIIELVFFAVFLGFLSAFCSLAEPSIVALSDFHYKKNVEANPKYSKYLEKILKNKPKYLSSIIMFNTIVNIGGSMFVGSLAANIFAEGDYFLFVLILTTSMLLFSEIKPKVFAAKNPEKVMKLIYIPIVFTTWVLTPIVNTINGFLNNNSGQVDDIHIDELYHFISSAAENGLIKKDEATIIKNIVDLRAKTSEYVSKNDSITMLNVSDFISENKDFILNSPHRRILLVNSFDKPVGMFFREEALKHLVLNTAEQSVSNIMHPLPIVDKDCPVSVLARSLQKSGSHLAVVVDNNGSILGVVSLTDIKGLIFS